MIHAVSFAEYLTTYRHALLLDVRSPAEYGHAHIPGALSLPLFTDKERATVGTAYRHESREKAIKIGLKYFGPRMVNMLEQVENWTAQKLEAEPGGKGQRPFPIVVHCWRGGMRSAGVAWLLDLYGFEVYTIQGGYKSFRQWCMELFARSWPLRMLGGFTGSGKTDILRQLSLLGEPVIDLEGLACHRGSAFGNIDMPPQPTQEMFENKLAMALHDAAISHQPIWLEDESQRIGDVNIPGPLFQQMRHAPLLLLQIPFAERLKEVNRLYGTAPAGRLEKAILRIQKRLGGLETSHALKRLETGELLECFEILLRYYDRWYEKGLYLNREQMQPQTISLPTVDALANARACLALHEIH
jgi:tRNA 2-selenouridine synthase